MGAKIEGKSNQKAIRKVTSKKVGPRWGRNPQTKAWLTLGTTVSRPWGGGRGRGKPLPEGKEGCLDVWKIADAKPPVAQRAGGIP